MAGVHGTNGELNRLLLTPNGISENNLPITAESKQKLEAIGWEKTKNMAFSAVITLVAHTAIYFALNRLIDAKTLKPVTFYEVQHRHQWKWTTFPLITNLIGYMGKGVHKVPVHVTTDMQIDTKKWFHLGFSTVTSVVTASLSWLALNSLTDYRMRNEIKSITDEVTQKIDDVAKELKPKTEEEGRVLAKNAQQLEQNFSNFGLAIPRATISILESISRTYHVDRIKELITKNIGAEGIISLKIKSYKHELDLFAQYEEINGPLGRDSNDQRARIKDILIPNLQIILDWLKNPDMSYTHIDVLFKACQNVELTRGSTLLRTLESIYYDKKSGLFMAKKQDPYYWYMH